MSPKKIIKPTLLKRYPSSTVWVYHLTSIFLYGFGGVGIMAGYNFVPLAAYIAGIVYLALAFSEMYIWMPLKVCPNCFYFKLENSRCMSGMNTISQKVAVEGKPADFGKRSGGLLCTDNITFAIMVLPLIAMIPTFFIYFSYAMLICFVGVALLIAFRYLLFFPRMACRLCRSKVICPQAARLGVKDV